MWYPIKSPFWLKAMHPQLTWHKSRKERTLYLTFDDGPIPDVTPSILKILKEYRAKATFFCVGENIYKHPDIFAQILKDGHSIGNHTYHHLNGRKSSNQTYINDILKCQELTKSNLFRPPYGRARISQYMLLKRNYEIIMWDVMSGDFDASLTPEKCLENVLKKSENGSIIVFHDSIKAKERVLFTLEHALKDWSEQNYRFEKL